MRLIFLIVILGVCSAEAQFESYEQIQERVNHSFGGNGAPTYNPRPSQYQQQQQAAPVRCRTRQRPGSGLFGNPPEYETVCNR